MSVLSNIGNVVLVGGASAAALAFGGEGLENWLRGGEDATAEGFWKNAADMVAKATDGVQKIGTSVIGEEEDKAIYAKTVSAVAVGAAGLGLKLALGSGDKDSQPHPGSAPYPTGPQNGQSI